MAKTALITGITGQDGALLAEFLLNRGYRVHGVRRHPSCYNTGRVAHLFQNPSRASRFFLHHGDLTDSLAITRLIHDIRPDEIYNLAAQSHVGVSFDSPEYTANTNALGTLRILEAIRTLRLWETSRFYQASTSELYGNASRSPQNEEIPFRPRSPYGVAKLYAYWITVTYREAYGIFASNGILFNHESPVRGETFVTRKVTRGLARILLGFQRTLRLGNLDARRDWGHARDYVEAMWRILQQDEPDDFVIATGEQHSVREFCECAAAVAGITLAWEGARENEVGIIDRIDRRVLETYGIQARIREGDVLVKVDPALFRPSEVDSLVGDYRKAREKLGWEPKISFRELVREMVEEDIREARRDLLCRDHGFGFSPA